MPHIERCSVSGTRPALFSSVFSQYSSASSFSVSFGVFLLGQSSCTISHCTFRANSTTGICCAGGNLNMSLSPASIENCLFCGPSCCGILALPHSRMSMIGCSMKDCSIGCIMMPFSMIDLNNIDFTNCCRGAVIVMNPNKASVSNCKVANLDRGFGLACFQTQMNSFSELLLSLAIVTDLILLLPFHKMDAVFKNEHALAATLPLRLVEALESEMVNGCEAPLPESVLFDIIRTLSLIDEPNINLPDASIVPQFSNNSVCCNKSPAFFGIVSDSFAGTFLVVAKSGRHLLQQEHGVFGMLIGDFLAYECNAIVNTDDVSALPSAESRFFFTHFFSAGLRQPFTSSCFFSHHVIGPKLGRIALRCMFKWWQFHFEIEQHAVLQSQSNFAKTSSS